MRRRAGGAPRAAKHSPGLNVTVILKVLSTPAFTPSVRVHAWTFPPEGISAWTRLPCLGLPDRQIYWKWCWSRSGSPCGPSCRNLGPEPQDTGAPCGIALGSLPPGLDVSSQDREQCNTHTRVFLAAEDRVWGSERW